MESNKLKYDDLVTFLNSEYGLGIKECMDDKAMLWEDGNGFIIEHSDIFIKIKILRSKLIKELYNEI